MAFFQNGSIVHLLTSTATSGGTTTLTASSRQYQIFTGSTIQTVKLPDATTMKNGMVFTIINDSTGTVTVNYNDNSLAATVESGKSKDFVLFDNSSSNGSFDVSVNSSSGAGASQSDLNLLRAGQLTSASTTSVPINIVPEELGKDTWSTTASLLSSVAQAPAPFTLNYYLYGCGGYTGSSTAIVQRFDDTNLYWLARQSMTNARYFAGSFAIGSFGYVVGGQTGGNAGLTFNEQYSDTLNTWVSKAAMTAATNSFAFQLGSYGFNAGGTDSGSTINTTNQQYDPNNNAWSLRAPLLTVQSYAQGANLGNYGYAVTGENGGGAVSIVQRYGHALNYWINVASTSSSGSRASAASTSAYLYKIGGNATGSGLEEYAEFTNVWRNKTSLGTSIASTYAGSVNDAVYTMGTGGATTVQKYQNSSPLVTRILKRSSTAPTNVYLLAKIGDLQYKIPGQVRTDGDNWKTVTANDSSSVLKQGDALNTKYLPYGLTYINGGCGGPSSYTSYATTEYYNPSSNVWTLRGNMITARAQAFGFAIEGAGYVTGGNGPSLITHLSLSSTEKYDEIADSYSSRSAIPSGAGNGIGLSILGFGYAWGGGPFGDITGTTPAANYQYNAGSDSWTTKATIPAAFAQQTGWMLDERGYMSSGGPDTSGSNQAIGYVYNPVNDAWLSIANAPTSDRQVHGHAQNGYGYRVAGVNVSSTATHKYDPVFNSWTTVASLNTNGTNGAGLSSGGFGYSVNNDSGGSQSEQYNSEQNTWTTKGSTNTSRRQPTCNFTPGVYRNYEVKISNPSFLAGLGSYVVVTKASINTARYAMPGFNLSGYGYCARGFNGSSNVNNAEKYNIDANSWINIASTSTSDRYSGGFSLGGYGYVEGGISSGTSFERWDDSTLSWSNKTSLPGSDASMSAFSLNGYGYHWHANSNKYSPATDSWVGTVVNPSNANEIKTDGAVLNGFGYSPGRTNTASATVEKYNDAANATLSVGSLNESKGYLFVNTIGGKMQVMGGDTNNASPKTTIEEYNDAANVWVIKANLSSGRTSGAAFTINDTGFAAGGTNGSSPLSITEQLIPSLKNIVLNVALEVN